jgi:amidase
VDDGCTTTTNALASVFHDFSQRLLVIGIMPDDGVVRVHPPIKRVFEDAVAKLKGAGHEIVQWDTSLNAHCIAIMVRSSLDREME